MNAKVIYGNGLMNRLTARYNYAAMTIGRYIFVATGRDSLSERTLNHERIHIAQQQELWWVGQWALYGLERLWRYCELVSGRRWRERPTISLWREAYYNISFEREAYDNQGDPDYLSHRPKMAWKKYLSTFKS